jgi:hypothetical protein
MAITYNKTKESIEKWGIDVTVQFFDDTEYYCTKTFRFKDSIQLKDEFESRMDKAILNVQDSIDSLEKPISIDVYDGIEKHFESNTVLTKEDFESLKVVPMVVSKVKL